MYRSLNPEHIIRTIEQLHGRVEERFPGSGLGKVAEELRQIGHEAVARSQWIARPLLPLRIGVGLLVLVLVPTILLLLANLKMSNMWESFADVVQGIGGGLNHVVFVGIAIFVLRTLEGRTKRRRALK